MNENGLTDNNLAWLNAAADYHLYLRHYERRTLSQAITAHNALRRAERDTEADRLTLDTIVGPLTMAGFYLTILTEWLPKICNSEDLQTRSEALGQTGKINHHLGNYETALGYLKQSLTIRQQIGDKAGLCATLFNMGHIHAQNKQMQEAVNAWVNVYLIAKQMNLAQALQALANLAPSLGMPEGLEGWEQLAQKMKDGGQSTEDESEVKKIKRFVHGLAQAVREKSPDAGKYFESVSKMAVDPNAPPAYQDLGKVLRDYMAGVKHPDLSRLSDDIAEIIRDEIQK
jgi:tetratricopeptide (TPR) repeat protein